MTKAEFVMAIGALAAGVGRPFTKEQHRVWYECLNDLTADQLNRAVKTWLCSRDGGFPKIKEIRDLVVEAEHGEHADWSEAWGLIVRASREWNGFDREAAFRAKAMLTPELYEMMKSITGGFDCMSLATKSDLAVWASNFRAAWGGVKGRQAKNRALPEELRPALEHIGYTPDEVRKLPAAMPDLEFEDHRRTEILRLAEHTMDVPEEPKPLRPAASDRPPSMSREEQLARLGVSK